MNPDWLLFGAADEIGQEPAYSRLECVTAAIKSELRHLEPEVGDEEFEHAWKRLMFRADLTEWEGDAAVFRVAVNAVRARFQEELRITRSTIGLIKVMNSLPAQLEAEGHSSAAGAVRDVYRAAGVPTGMSLKVAVEIISPSRVPRQDSKPVVRRKRR